MTVNIANRVQELTTTPGTGNLVLTGATTGGYKTFASAFGSNQFYYTAVEAGTGHWETGVATVSGTTLVRPATVIQNDSGSTYPVSFTTGTKVVFNAVPAESTIYYDPDGVPNIPVFVSADTYAELAAITIYPGGTIGAVTGDTDTSLIGFYQYDADSGLWVIFFSFDTLEQAQAYAEAAEAAAAAAEAALAEFAALAADYPAILVDMVAQTEDLLNSSDLKVKPTLSAGVTPIIANGRQAGLSIAIGASAAGDYVSAPVWMTGPTIDQLINNATPVYITCTFALSTGFLSRRTLATTNPVAVNRTVGGGVFAGTLISDTLVGNTLTRVLSYTPLAGDRAFGGVAQIASSSSTATADTIQMTGMTMRAVTGGVGNNGNAIMSVVAYDRLARASIGDIQDSVLAAGVSNNGATDIRVDGKRFGVSIPIGQTGYQSTLIFRQLFPFGMASLLTGCRVRVRAVASVNAEWARDISVNAQYSNSMSGGATNITVNQNYNYRIGNQFFLAWSFPMPGSDAVYISPFLRTETNATSAQIDTFTVTSLLIDIIAPGNSVDLFQLSERIRQLRSPQALDFGNQYSATLFTATGQNGASVIPDPDKDYEDTGLSIPGGVSGAASIIQSKQWFLGNEIDLFPGKTVAIQFICEVNSSWARLYGTGLEVVYQLFTTSGMRVATTNTTRYLKLGTTLIVSGWFNMAAGDIGLNPFLKIPTAATPTGTDDTIIVRGYRYGFIAAPNADLTLTQRAIDIAQIQQQNRTVQRALEVADGYDRIELTVDSSGGADYDTITDAIAAIPVNQATTATPYRILLLEGETGEYEENSLNLKNKSDIEVQSIGQERVHIKGYLPPDYSPAGAGEISTFDAGGDVSFQSLHVTAEGERYPYHFDGDSQAFATTIWDDCEVEHLGNKAQMEWQAANGGSPSSVWSTTTAIGSGVIGGTRALVRNGCKFIGGPRVTVGMLTRRGHAGFAAHNLADQIAPVRIELRGSSFTSQSPDEEEAIKFNGQGSGQRDLAFLIGNSINGDFSYGGAQWNTADPALQTANRWNFTLSGYGNTPAAFVYTDMEARALRIDSASPTGSVVYDLSSTGAVALCGRAYSGISDAGLPGSWGRWNVANTAVGPQQDQFICSMGYRLGDCTGTPKLLDVSIDGLSPVTITFDQDYTAVNNTTILAFIQTELGASAVASLYDVNAVIKPFITDEELWVQNTSASVVKRNTAMAWDTVNGVRTMTDSDSKYLFAGLAYENAASGGYLRVKFKGALRYAQELSRSDVGVPTVGQTFGVSNSTGQFAIGAAVPLFRVVNANSVWFL